MESIVSNTRCGFRCKNSQFSFPGNVRMLVRAKNGTFNFTLVPIIGLFVLLLMVLLASYFGQSGSLPTAEKGKHRNYIWLQVHFPQWKKESTRRPRIASGIYIWGKTPRLLKSKPNMNKRKWRSATSSSLADWIIDWPFLVTVDLAFRVTGNWQPELLSNIFWFVEEPYQRIGEHESRTTGCPILLLYSEKSSSILPRVDHLKKFLTPHNVRHRETHSKTCSYIFHVHSSGYGQGRPTWWVGGHRRCSLVRQPTLRFQNQSCHCSMSEHGTLWADDCQWRSWRKRRLVLSLSLNWSDEARSVIAVSANIRRQVRALFRNEIPVIIYKILLRFIMGSVSTTCQLDLTRCSTWHRCDLIACPAIYTICYKISADITGRSVWRNQLEMNLLLPMNYIGRVNKLLHWKTRIFPLLFSFSWNCKTRKNCLCPLLTRSHTLCNIILAV